MPNHTTQLARILNLPAEDIRRIEPLTGGCIAEVARIHLATPHPTTGDTTLVAKFAGAADAANTASADLSIEAMMLGYLAKRSSLPVPRVLHSEPTLLIMEHIPTERTTDPAAAHQHAAQLLANLHAIAATERPTHFGFNADTLIGPLPQPNPWTPDWIDFFREHRLLHFARDAAEHGPLPARTLNRLEQLTQELEDLLALPAGVPRQPSLIHGDAWTGNILLSRDRVAAFIDPACHYADAEVELAFTTLFGTFGRDFFDCYAALRPDWAPAMPSFFERRRDLYNLYPLLVHTRLFGGGYAEQVTTTLRRFGF